MLKLFALFTILALSFAANGWVGSWNVSNVIGNWNCGAPYPVSTVEINAKNSTTLTVYGMSSNGDKETWELPWGQFNTTGSDCKSGVPVCTSGDLETHGSDVHGQIKWYCSYKPQVPLYQGISITKTSPGEVSDSELFA